MHLVTTKCICIYLFSFAVFNEEIKIFLILRQSLSSNSPSFSEMYSVKTNKRSQYSVSAVSFKEICSLEIKSALLIP